ncbi:hypothetical protein M406DRAFT_53875 [Cryphonectria parasitica EP155]|uniref:Uncharacterized protein n=1 Tax=Cryphonectria parasitica (strain ATCC 38755 / EP155) TaxID=660469 RepID=A0A9P4YC48_CRYP1|nr:uncharacterized protein M406DRAFT_53875 [Cryphonectria parasitica EP155]KAF3770363.1 hypothetical protein M406DRAFT_53875 [Cryphonectria parasitica EP155]
MSFAGGLDTTNHKKNQRQDGVFYQPRSRSSRVYIAPLGIGTVALSTLNHTSVEKHI